MRTLPSSGVRADTLAQGADRLPGRRLILSDETAVCVSLILLGQAGYGLDRLIHFVGGVERP